MIPRPRSLTEIRDREAILVRAQSRSIPNFGRDSQNICQAQSKVYPILFKKGRNIGRAQLKHTRLRLSAGKTYVDPNLSFLDTIFLKFKIKFKM